MALFDREHIETDDDERVGVHLHDIGRAITIWAAMNHDRPVSVAEAALAFNTTPEIVKDAVQECAYTFLTGDVTDPQQQFIELDGE